MLLALPVGSWLNWIESKFVALRYFALNGTDHRSTPSRTPRSPLTFAGATPEPNQSSTSQSSPIGTWTDYPVKAA
jgi:hypothetical protein